jgi:hypothetical protein
MEPLFGNWKVLKSSLQYEKVDAFNIRIDIHVPADGEATLEYTVQTGL